nr:RNA-directed DNA polymerase, eukaryota [Tanacetum cinerariifolium]
MFGKNGILGNTHRLSRRSTWGDIILASKSLQDKEDSKYISVADKLGHVSLCQSFRRPPRGGIEQELLDLLCLKVDNIMLPNMADQWSWSLEGSGPFSVKSSRILIDDIYLPKAEVPTRWVNVFPVKVNIFAWKVFLDSLPTRLNISLRGIDIHSLFCPVCNSVVESTSHLFFSCPVARQVWRKILNWWELDDVVFHSYNDWILWLVNIQLPKKLKEFFEGVCYELWWLVWRDHVH